MTDEGTIAFFAHEGQFYAYGDEDEEIYSVPVKDLDHSIARYDYTDAELPGSVIVVDGTQENVANKWVTVSFFIRTGNERRLSNFLLYQAAYAELYFSSKMWPEFSRRDLEKALVDYAARSRRFGNVGGKE